MLVDELLEAACEIDRLCDCNFISCPNKARTAALRARAARVLELERILREDLAPTEAETLIPRAMFDMLTGPLPAVPVKEPM